MLRRVDERCSAFIQDEHLVSDVPGCRITHRMMLDKNWWLALDAALELCSKPARSMWEKVRDLNLLLDTLDDKLSGLERRIIYTNAMSENEA